MLGAMFDPNTEACSEASHSAGEPLAGSASDAPLFAAIAWPKAKWHHDKAALSEGLPESVGSLEKAARAAGKKLQLRLFARVGAPARPGLEVVCADFSSGDTLVRHELDAESAVRVIADFAAGKAHGPALREPLVLVCTDGRHDRCCGKLGQSLVTALRGSLAVAEVSHLGGHRLAPNCLVLPTGHLYGRVGPADVPAILDAVRHGTVYAPCYRGQSGLDELSQVAEAAAFAHGGRHDWRVGEPEGAGDERLIAVSAGDLRLEVTCERRTYLGIASCGDAEPESRARWVATGALPVSVA